MRKLPFELVIEILARVPFKGLKRFRCVCKSWRSLFQEKWFIRHYLTYAPSRMMLCGRSSAYSFIYEDGKTIAQEVDLSSGDQGLVEQPRVVIIGHCDGLFCLHFADRSLAIWNPALRELRIIPAITTKNLNSDTHLMGFGYDKSIEDYKILLVVPISKQDGCFEAQVLTVKSNCSRIIDFPSRPWLCLETKGSLAGENIFWQLYNNVRKAPEEEILSFSLVSETFSYCLGPKLGKGEYRNLLVSRGNLYVVSTVRRGDNGKDYVLWCAQHDKEDKGVIKSWSLNFRFTLDNIETSIGSRVNKVRPGNVILITDAAMLLMVRTSKDERKLGAYNFKDKSVTVSDTHLGYGNLIEYIETLVSPRSLLL